MENNLDNSNVGTQQLEDLGWTLNLGQASVGSISSSLESGMQCMDQSNRVADQLDCGVKEWGGWACWQVAMLHMPQPGIWEYTHAGRYCVAPCTSTHSLKPHPKLYCILRLYLNSLHRCLTLQLTVIETECSNVMWWTLHQQFMEKIDFHDNGRRCMHVGMKSGHKIKKKSYALFLYKQHG